MCNERERDGPARSGEVITGTLEEGTRRLFGWLGTACLVLIIPVKAVRFVDATMANDFAVGIAPSLLGPAGLFFLLLSGRGRLSNRPLHQVAAIVAAVASGLEFAQLLPRPGILARVSYTFDWCDIVAGIISVCIGYGVALFVGQRNRS